MLSGITFLINDIMHLSLIPFLFVPVFIYFLTLIIIRIIRF